MRHRILGSFVLLLARFALGAGEALAAEPPELAGSMRVRGEAWSWFATPGRDDEYAFLGSLLRLSASQRLGGLDWQVEAAIPSLLSLPEDAVAAAPQGQLGFGGSYFAANGEADAAALVLKQGFVRFGWPRGPLPGDSLRLHSFRLGRFVLVDGAEVTPENPRLAALKSGRVAHRLVGNFGFSHVGRSVDGVQYTHAAPSLHLTAVAFRPTAGAFNVEANDQLDVDVLYLALTRSAAAADARLFLLGYHDRRNVTKTDNRPLAVRAAEREDVEVLTLGGHYLAAFGNFETLVWGAAQGGRWGALDHRATAFDLEGGYHWQGALKPVVRAGFFRSSGDGERGDGEHGTFFQVLPTPRIYARFPFYNAMNSTDAFVQASFEPAARLKVTSELHLLGASADEDLWYAGGGAFEAGSFGFAGRPASGGGDSARVLDLSLDYTLDARTSLTLYVAAADGGELARAIFADDSARYAYLEISRKF
jgi:hypothetical protein